MPQDGRKKSQVAQQERLILQKRQLIMMFGLNNFMEEHDC